MGPSKVLGGRGGLLRKKSPRGGAGGRAPCASPRLPQQPHLSQQAAEGFALGKEEDILAGEGAEEKDDEEIDDHRHENGEDHGEAGKELAEEPVGTHGGHGTDHRGGKGAHKDLAEIGHEADMFFNKVEIHRRDGEAPKAGGDGRAVDVEGGNADQHIRGDQLDGGAADHGDNRLAFQLMGLQEGTRDGNGTDEEDRKGENRQ